MGPCGSGIVSDVGVIAVFSYGTWTARYPEFTQISPALAQLFFNEATDYHRNDGGGPVNNQDTQLRLLNMITAHIAALNTPDNQGNAPSNKIVGKIQSAGQGTVNVMVAYDATNPEQWYAQTTYGAAYWAATAQFRTFRPVRGYSRRRFGLFPWTPN
jgi:hypothetical protein